MRGEWYRGKVRVGQEGELMAMDKGKDECEGRGGEGEGIGGVSDIKGGGRKDKETLSVRVKRGR